MILIIRARSATLELPSHQSTLKGQKDRNLGKIDYWSGRLKTIGAVIKCLVRYLSDASKPFLVNVLEIASDNFL